MLFAPNHIDVPALYWGCHWAGGVVSPANPTYTIDELKYQLDNSGAKGLVAHESLLHIAAAAAKRVNLPVKKILVVGDHSPAAGLQHVKSMLADSTIQVTRPVMNAATDTAFLVYSSGTTGQPKGAILTHTNVVAANVLLKQIEDEHMDCQKDQILALLPTYHIFGRSAIMAGLST